jgi:predicted PurR-regulated permease PerM
MSSPEPTTVHVPAADARAPGWWSLHLWQIQPLRDALLLASVFGVLWLGYRLSLVTVPMLLALLLAYLVEPVVRRVTGDSGRKRLLSRPGAAIGLIAGLLLLVVVPAGLGLTFGGIQAASYGQMLANKAGVLVDSVNKPDDRVLAQRADALGPAWARIRTTLASLRVEHERLARIEAGEVEPGAPASAPGAQTAPPPDRVGAILYRLGREGITWLRAHAQDIGKQAVSTGAGLLGIVGGVVGSVGSIGFGLFLTAFFFYFFCTGYGRVLAFWQSLIPERRKGRAIELLGKMDAVIAGFVRGRLTICAVLVLYYTLGYWAIGVPAPLVLGPIVGLLCLLPYVGSLGMIAAMALLALSAPETGLRAEWWWALAGPLLVHAGGQVIDDYVLTPRIQGQSTGMDTPTILFASLAGGVLAGFYGLLIAIPVAACSKILLRELVWPRFAAWAEGKRKDPLPVG